MSIVKEISPAIRVIMGETSSVAGEGAGTASDTFAAIFMFLDKLAIAAVTGHDAVFHQTILDPTMNEAGQHEGSPSLLYQRTRVKGVVSTCVGVVMLVIGMLAVQIDLVSCDDGDWAESAVRQT